MKKIFLLLIATCIVFSCHVNSNKNSRGREIFIKYINAIGGEQNLRKIKTFYSVKESSLRGSQVKAFNWIQYPNKVALEFQYPGRVAWVKYDNNKGIEITPDGNKPLSPALDSMMQKEAYIFPELYYIDKGFDFTLIGDTLNDYIVKVSNGGFKIFYYINKASYLVSEIKDTKTEDFFIKDTIIEDISMPYITQAVSLSNPSDTIKGKYLEFKVNTDLNDTIFEW